MSISTPRLPLYDLSLYERSLIPVRTQQSACERVLEQFDIGVHHQLDELGEARSRLPPQDALGLGRISSEEVDLGRPVVARIDLDVTLPVEPHMCESKLRKLSDRVRLAGCDHEVVGLVVLQHHPHCLDVLGRIAPVPAGIEISEVELVLQAGLDASNGPGDLASHERLPA